MKPTVYQVARDLQQQSAAAHAWAAKASRTRNVEDLRKAMVYAKNTKTVLDYAQQQGYVTGYDLSKGYKLAGSRKWKGMTISVETPKGGVRQWSDPFSGQKGMTFMLYDYGYFRGADGVDGDKVDVFVGPDPETAPNVYVVRQLRMPDFRYYDEDKCMVGFASLQEAKMAYQAHYNDPRFCGDIDAYPVPLFVQALQATKKAPAPVGGWLQLKTPQLVEDHSLMSAGLRELFKDAEPQPEKFNPFALDRDEQKAMDELMSALAALTEAKKNPWLEATTADAEPSPGMVEPARPNPGPQSEIDPGMDDIHANYFEPTALDVLR